MNNNIFLEDNDLTTILQGLQQPPGDSGVRIASRARQLYEAAKQRSWNAAHDLDWPDSLPTCEPPFAASSDAFSGFRPFDRLPLSLQTQLRWQQHALEINDILHGEQAAMLLAAQLVNSLPSGEGKLFACSQVADEARHVEFFARYMQLLSRHVPHCEVGPPTPGLARIIRDALQDPRWDVKLITCQILIESLALTRFQEMRSNTRVPLLRAALKLILRDEARHTHFGITYLRKHSRNLSEDARETRSQHVIDQTVQLIHSDKPVTGLAERFRWDGTALQQHLRRFRFDHPQVIQRRLLELRDNMRDAGLLTTRAEHRLIRLEGLSNLPARSVSAI